MSASAYSAAGSSISRSVRFSVQITQLRLRAIVYAANPEEGGEVGELDPLDDDNNNEAAVLAAG